MGLEKILPKAMSFLPGGLGQNMGDLQSEFFQRKGIIKKEAEMTKEELQQDYKQRRATALIGECFRDIPTIAFLYFGGAELGLAYYAGATWVADRFAYFAGCAGH
jgi:hypothetical protein